jgi:hypothetical protein
MHKADLIQNIDIHNYNTRLNKDYLVKFCRTTLFKRSVVNMGIEKSQTEWVKNTEN